MPLNYQNIEKDPQRISKNNPFIDQYHWKEINILNILYVPYNDNA